MGRGVRKLRAGRHLLSLFPPRVPTMPLQGHKPLTLGEPRTSRLSVLPPVLCWASAPVGLGETQTQAESTLGEARARPPASP